MVKHGPLGRQYHCIFSTTIKTSTNKRYKTTARITEWNNFRQMCEVAPDTILDINKWVKLLNQDVTTSMRKTEVAQEQPMTDSRILHMWEAHEGVMCSWQHQRHKQQLRHRIAKLEREIEAHSTTLERHQWGAKFATA